MTAAIMAGLTWLAAALLPLLLYPLLRLIYYAFLKLLPVSLVAGGTALFSSLYGSWMITYVLPALGFILAMKFMTYMFRISMGILGFGAVYYLYFDVFIEDIFSAVIDELIALSPEVTTWLEFFGVFDGLRLIQATFIWIIGFKIMMWALKPPTIL